MQLACRCVPPAAAKAADRKPSRGGVPPGHASPMAQGQAIITQKLYANLGDFFKVLLRPGGDTPRFLHQHVLFDEPIPSSSFDHRLNPWLLEAPTRPVKYIDMIRVIARRAAGHGILLWLVAHSPEPLWCARAACLIFSQRV